MLSYRYTVKLYFFDLDSIVNDLNFNDRMLILISKEWALYAYTSTKIWSILDNFTYSKKNHQKHHRK